MHSFGCYVKFIRVVDAAETIQTEKNSAQNPHYETKISFGWTLAEPKLLDVLQGNVGL